MILIDDGELLLWYGWLIKGVQHYFQLGPFSEILTIVNLRHAANRVWTWAEPEFRLGWTKLCNSDNRYTTAAQLGSPVTSDTSFLETEIWRTFVEVENNTLQIYYLTVYFIQKCVVLCMLSSYPSSHMHLILKFYIGLKYIKWGNGVKF